MLSDFFSTLTNFIINTISAFGYAGIVLLMAFEGACIPLPSVITMPFAGFLVAQGRFSLLGIAFAGAVGNVLGSTLIYWIGYKGGRPLFEKYGKYFFVSQNDIRAADEFFAKHGSLSSFLSRLLPVVRIFISVPAGIFREDFRKFFLYSFVGSFLWSLFLGFLGMKLGEQWSRLWGKFHDFDLVIAILIIFAAAWWIWRHKKNGKRA